MGKLLFNFTIRFVIKINRLADFLSRRPYRFNPLRLLAARASRAKISVGFAITPEEYLP